MNPGVSDVVSGNVFDKYGSKNPIVRMLMNGFFSRFDELLVGLPVQTILEVGCGEGVIGARLLTLFPGAAYRGIDVAEDVIREAKQRSPLLTFEVLSVYDLPEHPVGADLVVASEVLEHLDEPARGMDSLCAVPFRYILISVPREPIWRILNVVRGRYLTRWGNTPGHVNHWSKASFVKFLGRYSDHLTLERLVSPFPWTMVLCSKRQR
jgi:2-polyprenyl-3-methyl-5-hydroxy-6-metoxy-1,4-benzoquinol methylase